MTISSNDGSEGGKTMHEEFCPICGAQSWSYLYESRESREVVGCDICLMALDEIDAYEEGLFDEGI